MKVYKLIPAIIALVILVGSPFGLGRICDSDPRGGLICYCGCSEKGEGCTMISCKGCCGGHTGAVTDRWSPEMIPEFHPVINPVKIVYGDVDVIQSPPSAYLEVPDKPPEHA